MAATAERARTHDVMLTERETQLNAKAKDLATHEQALVDALRVKDNDLESLIQ